jgi:hypothetical protein
MQLSRAEQMLVVNSLMAISPSGGGSAAFSLARKLMLEFDVLADVEEVVHLQFVAVEEFLGE